MAIAISPIVKRYRYNGVDLPTPPGMSEADVRALHSARFPELLNAEVVAEEPVDGRQEITFRRAVGTKG
ncbi:PRTRC system protein C [Duganella sp. FT92W]|uniref:PRTRC system protein C n=1 Tax=Pseudoduganella rivuli TaxID=2666085 RepID=A0A7X2IIT8_9BURK|nr:PRTRC system protein C [Pseudoduganella rivuli]MRV70601.1 PRTRC system protein C [Pseudoduganella rivuli]